MLEREAVFVASRMRGFIFSTHSLILRLKNETAHAFEKTMKERFKFEYEFSLRSERREPSNIAVAGFGMRPIKKCSI